MISKSILLLFSLLAMKISAQKIYYTNFKADADIVVFVVKNKTDADIIVKKIYYNDEVKLGYWKEVKLKSDTDLIIYVSDKNTTDVTKIYFTKFNDEIKFNHNGQQ